MANEKQNTTANYLVLLQRQWKIVVISFALCATVGAISHLLMPKTYSSSSMLLVYPPLFKSGTAGEAGALSELMPRALPVETYKTIAESKDLLGEVIQKLALEDTTADALSESCNVRLIELGSRTPQYGKRYAQTIIFAVQSVKPETAASIAQTWAERFKTRVDGLGDKGLTETYKLVESMWKETKSQLEKAEEELNEFRIEWNHELASARLTDKQDNLTQLERKLIQLSIDIPREKAHLKALQTELEQEDRKDVLFRSPSDDVYWQERLKPGGGKIDSEMGLRSELLNSVYIESRIVQITTMITLSGLEREMADSLVIVEALESDIVKLNEEMAVKSTEEIRLTRDMKTLEQTFGLTATSLEKSRVAQLNKASDIQIVGKAIVPEIPSGTRGAHKVVLAGFVGIVLSVGAIIANHTITSVSSVDPGTASKN